MNRLIALGFVVALSACAPSVPSEGQVQTAIAQTVAAVPTVAATPTDAATPTPMITNTPAPTNTPRPSSTPRPSATPRVGTRTNPIPVGVAHNFPGYGPLVVTEARWQPGVTGLAIVRIDFTCERPADQACNVLDFLLGAVGGSGSSYQQEFSSGVPTPGFWDFMSADIYGGGTKTGYAGFLITQPEQTLAMTVEAGFSQDGATFFNITVP